MPENNQRNMLIFVVVSLLLLTVYQFFILGPQQQKAAAEAKTKAAATQPGTPAATAAAAKVFLPRAQALAASPRVPIKTPAVSGSISLQGGRIDDLYLNNYRETVDPKSPPVELLRPRGAQYSYYTESGWTGANLPGLPNNETLWTLTSGQALTPTTPVVLSYDNGQGLVFTRQIAVDDKFMFTITDTAANHGGQPVNLTPFASVERDLASAKTVAVAFEGGLGVLGEDKHSLTNKTWKKWADKGNEDFTTKGGWLGLTDKYWLAALVPDQNEKVNVRFGVNDGHYSSSYVAGARAIAPGQQASSVTHVFAGAKVVPILKSYEKTLGVPRFDEAVDWGIGLGSWEAYIARPMFWALEQLYKLFGNLGLALLGLTVIVRLIFFYPANLSYGSMAKMKKVQPEVDALRTQFKDDPQGLQREMMAIYAKNKVNPLMGCLPMLATIPVLIGLYKVLSVTIEMRHAPFFFLTQDLSARDPTTIWNLFGLIPWDPGHLWLIGNDQFLHLGIWALLYGFTTWLSQSMSPPAPDPAQQRIMQFMPLIFTFVLAPLAVGLLIYYTWSNLLTVLQQYVLMRKHGVDNPIDQGLARLRGGKKA